MLRLNMCRSSRPLCSSMDPFCSMIIAPASSLSRFEACWLAEAVRLRELASGNISSAPAAADINAAFLVVGEEEAWLLRRAEGIARADGLLEATLAWRRRATWVLSLLCVVAILSGFSAALGFFGAEDRAVNVIWTLLGLLGMPVLALFFWILTPLLGGRIGVGVLGGFWLWLMTHAPRFGGNDNRAAQVVVARGLAAMTGRTGLSRWWLSFITHSLWLLALLASVVALLLVLTLRSYDFVLETTILAPENMSALVQGFAALPGSLGFAVPDADMIAQALGATHADGSTAALAGDVGQSEAMRRAWSSWLLGGLVVYAMLPRLLVWVLCAVRLWQLRAGLSLDLSLPGYAELLDHNVLSSPQGQHTPGIVDAAPLQARPQQVAQIHRVHNHDAMLLGLELGRDILWPPARLSTPRADFSVIEMVESREQRRSALAQLIAHPPARVLLACDVRLSPDRGTLSWVAEVSRHAGELRVWLVSPAGDNNATVQEDREEVWRSSLAEIGLGEERLMMLENTAYSWLNQHD